MANFNKIIMAGNLTRDPELRYTPQGSAVCEFALAASRSYTDGSGEQREETCFIECEAWGRTGEVVSEYVGRGDPLLVEGRLEQQRWESRGEKHSKHVINVSNITFLGGGQ